MKYIKHLVSIIAALSISSIVYAAEVKMAKANWDTGYFKLKFINKLQRKWDTK